MPLQGDSHLFETIVAHLSDGIYVIQDGKAVYLNKRFCDIFGYESPEALIGRDFFEEIYPERDSATFFRSLHDRLQSEDLPRISWAQLTARCDGTPFWLEVDARQIIINNTPYILGIFHDQTDCKLISEAMHLSQETLRLLVDAMEDRVYVVTDDYKIVYANRKMMMGLCGDIKKDLCYKVCRGLNERCPDCSKDDVFASDKPMYKEFFNEQTKSWFSVIELAIRMPGINQPTKLAVARDITQRMESEQRIRALSHSLLNAQEVERKHISRELHDDLGQRLNAIKLGMDTLLEVVPDRSPELVAGISTLTASMLDAIRSLRQLSSGLRPLTLENSGLVNAVKEHCETIATLHDGLTIEIHAAGMEAVKLEPDMEINLFRVIQEALHNIIKHADAERVKIRLIASHPVIRLKIEDNGKGFDVNARPPKGFASQRLGLVGMAERIDLLHGTFSIRSRPHEGTRIIIEVPYKEH